jgi:hypothetical protein
LRKYRWSSYPWYLKVVGSAPEWLVTERVLVNLGLGLHDRKGYEADVPAYDHPAALRWASE